ncbi:MAG: cytochrome P460 family protein [Pirellulales bacterium]
MNFDNQVQQGTPLAAFLALCICIAMLLTACQPSSDSPIEDVVIVDESEKTSQLYFRIDEGGKVSRPEGYRNWVYVGTPLTPNELNPPEAPFPEFHNVYIDPDSWTHYERTGEFREGTILVKELVSVGSKAAVSGAGYFMGDFLGLEAAIKSRKHFPNEPGNWAYFSFGHSYPLAESAEAFPSDACNTCHATSAADDFVFTQYYPILRASNDAQGKGPALMAVSERKDLMDAMTDATATIGEPRVETGTSVGPVPTDLDALFEYLVAGRYESFSQRESVAHPSRGPHTKFGRPVRVFISDELAASMAAKSTSHPAGSSIVKELYLDDGKTLEGWAVMVKTQDDTDGGNGWFWYEVTSTTDPTQLGGGQAGNGIPLCTGCHTTGKDYVITEYPLQ